MARKALGPPCDELDIPGVGKAVKHPPCEIDVDLDYSLAEQDTGRKWLDTRSIFCKTLPFTYGVGPLLDIPHGVEDLDHIVPPGIEGVIRRREDFHQWCDLRSTTHPLPGNVGEQMLVSVMRDVVRLEDNSSQWDNEPGWVTIYYVKLPAP